MQTFNFSEPNSVHGVNMQTLTIPRRHKFSYLMFVKNEASHIGYVIDTMVNDADEIIISDNKSTDGTSEIIQRYANQHHNVKHLINNSPSTQQRWLDVLDQASNHYCVFMSGHDLCLPSSIHNMLDIMANNLDLVHVAPKNVIKVDLNYTIQEFYKHPLSNDDLMSDSPLVRMKILARKFGDGAMFYGLYRKDILTRIIYHFPFPELEAVNPLFMGTDHSCINIVAQAGKIALCDKSLFFRLTHQSMIPDNDYSLYKLFTILTVYYSTLLITPPLPLHLLARC
ncbi:MAG: glycosyltransferase family 2 protein [Planctomycetota bacterium]|nr:glycosyltransferase family 2 protein [Planctomycetota bacterium]